MGKKWNRLENKIQITNLLVQITNKVSDKGKRTLRLPDVALTTRYAYYAPGTTIWLNVGFF